MPRPGPVSTAELTKVARVDWDRAIAAVAGRQHGVITRQQLLAIGVTDGGIRSREAAGRLHRLHSGAFAVGLPPRRAHPYWLAAVLVCGTDASLSYAAAAALLRMRSSSASLIDVTSPTGAGRGREGIRAHRAVVPCWQLTIVDGIPTTTVARTIVDLAGVLSPGRLEYTIHRAQTSGVFDRDELIAVLAETPNRPGTRAVRRILAVSPRAEDRVNSGNERRFLRICRAAGVAEPQANRWIAVPDGHGFDVDFCWPEQRLIVEIDSRLFHTTARAFENDPHRDRLLMLAGWRVARFTERDLRERPDEVGSQIRRLLPTVADIRRGGTKTRHGRARAWVPIR